MTSRRLLILANGLHEASCRFRFGQYLPYLRAQNIAVDVVDLAVSTEERRKIFASAANYDSVLLHRVLLRWRDFAVFRRHVKNYVFDFDDAIMMRDSSRRNRHSWQRLMRFRRMTQNAQNVVAGNNYLGVWARKFNSQVEVIPTSIELKDYAIEYSNAPKDTLTIGWIGTKSNLMYLQTVVPALSRVAQKFPNAQLKIVADDFLDVPQMRVEKKLWKLEDEVCDVQSFDIGIMPLPDDEWTRGKCALKILQSFAASVPVACSPVGANLDVVENGANGFFATSENEWATRLEELLRDAILRRKMGADGRRKVEIEYSIEANAPRFMQSLFPELPLS